jgi:hypothetical protein
MKKITKATLFPILGILTLASNAFACEITLSSDKESYQVNDVAVVNAEIVDTHRNCTFRGKEPKVNATGLELTAKTKYKEKSEGTWTIKYKLKVLAPKNQFTVLRDNCPQGGGSNSIVIKVADVGAAK